MPKFLRRTHNRYSKLGKRRKKKQVWRRPTGRDNKMREKRRGYGSVVKIGYKKGEEEKRIIISNPNELENIGKKDLIIVGNVGKKKKIEIAKKAKAMKIKLYNLNAEKFLEEIEKLKEKEKVKKEAKTEKKKEVKSKEKKEKKNESK